MLPWVQTTESLGRSKIKVLEVGGRTERLQEREIMAYGRRWPLGTQYQPGWWPGHQEWAEPKPRGSAEAQKSGEQLILRPKLLFSEFRGPLCGFLRQADF